MTRKMTRTTEMEIRNNLVTHTEFIVFQNTIFKNSKFDIMDLYPEGHYDGNYNFHPEKNHFHVRLDKIAYTHNMVWHDEQKAQLQRRFDELNSKTKDLKFELTDTCDYDYEEGEKMTAARFYFKVKGDF